MTALILNFNDFLMSFLSDSAFLMLWCLLLSSVSMALYVLFSPQGKLDDLRTEGGELRQKILLDEEPDKTVRYAVDLLKVSSLRFVYSVVPALLAGLPIIYTYNALDLALERAQPEKGEMIEFVQQSDAILLKLGEGKALDINAQGNYYFYWSNEIDKPLTIYDSNDSNVEIKDFKAQLELRKFSGWSYIFPSYHTYLAEDFATDYLLIDYPRKHWHAFGPELFRYWQAYFIIFMLLFSLAFKIVFKIH